MNYMRNTEMDTKNRQSLFQMWENILGHEFNVPHGIEQGLRLGVTLLGMVLVILIAISTAHADGRKKPEQGEVNQHNQQFNSQDQWQRQIQTQGQDQRQAQQQDAIANNEGLSQSVTAVYEDRALKTVLGSAYSDSDPGSTAPCLTSKRGIGVLGIVSLSGKTSVDEECLEEVRKNDAHKRSVELAREFQAIGRPDLATGVLCAEAGIPGCQFRELKGGNKADPDPEKEALKQEVSKLREEKVHGDIVK